MEIQDAIVKFVNLIASGQRRGAMDVNQIIADSLDAAQKRINDIRNQNGEPNLGANKVQSIVSSELGYTIARGQSHKSAQVSYEEFGHRFAKVDDRKLYIDRSGKKYNAKQIRELFVKQIKIEGGLRYNYIGSRLAQLFYEIDNEIMDLVKNSHHKKIQAKNIQSRVCMGLGFSSGKGRPDGFSGRALEILDLYNELSNTTPKKSGEVLIAEIAERLYISESTVSRKLKAARQWDDEWGEMFRSIEDD